MSWVVLLIEDDTELQEMLGRVLDARGLRILIASNGAEAIEVVRRSATRPSVILLDMMMPVMDGTEFLRRQPTVPLLAGVPVIIVSATPELPDPLPATVFRVLTKPPRLAELLSHIRDAVGAPRAIAPTPSGPIRAVATTATTLPVVPVAPREPTPAEPEPAIAMAAAAPAATDVVEPTSPDPTKLES